jgi:hypothetical protein
MFMCSLRAKARNATYRSRWRTFEYLLFISLNIYLLGNIIQIFTHQHIHIFNVLV